MRGRLTEKVKKLCKKSKKHICASRMAEITQKVFELFKDVDPETFVFSGKSIAQKLGIKVIPYSSFSKENLKKLQSFNTSYWQDGMCICQNNIKAIYYRDQNTSNKEDNDFFTEFIINHELAHLILKHTQQCSLAEEEATFFSGTMSMFLIVLKKLKELDALPLDIIKKLLNGSSAELSKKEVQCD